MAEESEAAFGFDVKPFMDGLKTVGQGFQKTFADVKRVAASIANALAVPFKKIKSEALKAMPIVGQSFEFVKDVVARNLFAPLQREVLPILQKLVKWATDNRTVFVKWGQVIANVFKGVWEAAKTLFDAVKSVVSMISNSLLNKFGGAFASIEELVNTIVWKVVMIMLFLSESFRRVTGEFQPLITTIVGFVTTAAGQFVELGLKMLDAFSKGDNFSKMIAGVNGALQGIAAVIGPVVKGVGDLMVKMLAPDEAGNSIGDVIEKLGDLTRSIGELIGLGVSAFFTSFNESVGGLSTTLAHILTYLDNIINKMKAGGAFQNAMKDFGFYLSNGVMVVLNGLADTLGFIDWAMQGFNKEVGAERKKESADRWQSLELFKEISNRTVETNITKNVLSSQQERVLQWLGGELVKASANADLSGEQKRYFFDSVIREVSMTAYNERKDVASVLDSLRNTNFFQGRALEWKAGAQKDFLPNLQKDVLELMGETMFNVLDHTGYSSNGTSVEAKNPIAVNDAIITKTGRIIRTAPDDNIYAFKSLGGSLPAISPPSEFIPSRSPIAMTPPSEFVPSRSPIAMTPPSEFVPSRSPIAMAPPSELAIPSRSPAAVTNNFTVNQGDVTIYEAASAEETERAVRNANETGCAQVMRLLGMEGY
jgi:hypothetical protein